MAPSALAAPIAPISPHSAGRATAAALAGGGFRSGRITCLPAGHSGKIVLQPNELLRSSRQRKRFALRSGSDDSKPTEEKTPFGYTRKDVLLIGLGVTLFGVGLKYGLELVGVDSLQAGNVVQLVIVLGMTVGWISTYMFRVANKDMTYAQQLRDYEKQVMDLSQGLLSQLYHQGVEIDALIRLESERMRAGLEELRRRHVRAVVATVERAAAGRLRAVETELERARCRNAELEERLRQMTAEGQAWLGVAKSHEAVAAGLRATLDQLLQSPCAIAAGAGEGNAEDALSCCFEAPAGDNADDALSKAVATSCKACGEGEACVLLLPCRHLCLCRACEAAADACPVCAATKNASLHVLLS